MAYQVIDVETGSGFGVYETLEQARARVRDLELTDWEIWTEDGNRCVEYSTVERDDYPG